MGHHKHSYSMKNFIHDAGSVTKPLHKDVQSLVKGANKDLTLSGRGHYPIYGT